MSSCLTGQIVPDQPRGQLSDRQHAVCRRRNELRLRPIMSGCVTITLQIALSYDVLTGIIVSVRFCGELQEFVTPLGSLGLYALESSNVASSSFVTEDRSVIEMVGGNIAMHAFLAAVWLFGYKHVRMSRFDY